MIDAPHRPTPLARLPRRAGRTLALVASVAVAFACAGAALADAFIDRVNAGFADVPASQRSDVILLPALAKLTDPPKSIYNPPLTVHGSVAAITPVSSPDWPAVKAWVMEQPQRDGIEALKKATAVEKVRESMEFAQPYGGSAAGPEANRLKIFTELGPDDDTLLLADFKHLPPLSKLVVAAHVEVTRLQFEEGKPAEAMDLAVRTIWLGRQMLNRAFLEEHRWGAGVMTLGLMRLRDIAYVDMRSESPKLMAEELRALGRRLEVGGLLSLTTWRLPQGEQIAVEQLIAKVMGRAGTVDKAAFVRIMSRYSAGDRPLRAFSESARWEALAKLHAPARESSEALAMIYGDWERRWVTFRLNRYDATLRVETDYSKLDKTKFAVLDATMRDQGSLFFWFDLINVEAMGTRQSLGVYGFKRRGGNWPPDITATRPMFVRAREIDPFDLARFNSLRLFVPGARRAAVEPFNPQLAETLPRQHVMDVFPEVLQNKFKPVNVTLDASTFVLYSAGPNGTYDGCIRATQMADDAQNRGDYLLWPPVLSLVRESFSTP